MATVHVHADFDCSADALWGLLGDFANMSWVPGAAAMKIEFEGEGVGMARLLTVGGGPATREELWERDEAQRRIHYGITENNPLPCESYRATMIISETAPDRCQLSWQGWFEPKDLTEEQTIAAVNQFYEMVLGSIRETVASL